MNKLKRVVFVLTISIVRLSLCWGQAEVITILHLNDTHSTLASVGPRTPSLKGTQGGWSVPLSSVQSFLTVNFKWTHLLKTHRCTEPSVACSSSPWLAVDVVLWQCTVPRSCPC